MFTCYVIGSPIRHSLSPVLHEAGYRKYSMEDDFSFERHDCQADHEAE